MGEHHDAKGAGEPPAEPDDERRTIVEMMTKGTYGWILLATKDLDGTFARLQGPATPRSSRSRPISRTGVRDCAFRGPACNHIRIQELR